MKNNYLKRGALILGAVALLGTASANAEGAWRNVNHLAHNFAGFEGWNGCATGGAEGVGEIFYSAGLVYKVLPDMPAGTYTLTANALYRPQGAPENLVSKKAGTEVRNAFIFINDTEEAVKNLFDEYDMAELENEKGEYTWAAPNDLAAVRTAFNAGKYANSITVEHPGGDLYVGIRNKGNLNGLDEWLAFGDFKLSGPNGNIELPAFENYNRDANWNVQNMDNGAKGRGIQNGGVWSKTNASIYNHSQTLEGLPAGKYRLVVTGWNCHFLGSYNGYYVPMKGAFEHIIGQSAKDMWDANATEYPAGQVKGGEAYNPSMYYPVEALEAYVYMNIGEKRRGGFDEGSYVNWWMEGYMDGDDFVEAPLVEGVEAVQTKIKNLFEEKLDVYPDANNHLNAAGNWAYMEGENPKWWESGCNRESAAFLVANPTMYENVAELELKEESNTLTFGVRKDVNQNNYWQITLDWRLERYDDSYVGYKPNAGVEDVEVVDNNAPVEYFNLQGVRVANPENGLFIVKQGNKVSKQVIR